MTNNENLISPYCSEPDICNDLFAALVEKIGAYRVPLGRLVAGYEKNRGTITDFLRYSKDSIGLVTDKYHPEIEHRLGWFEHETGEARSRGITIRQIVDITSSNLRYCKSLAGRTDELRHLSGVRTFFGVSDRSFLGMVVSISSGDEVSIRFVESNLKDVIDLKQLVFSTLWSRSQPASIRFDELRGGRTIKVARKEKIGEFIDRFYRCGQCNEVFVFLSETEDHRIVTGHSVYREYPLT